jgi:uncharacterized membrane protein YcaP (DUF421 family)
MTFVIYAVRCFFMFFVLCLGLRIVGKKSIAQITTYELAGIFLITMVAAQPLVYKIPTKASEGVVVLSLAMILVGKLSLSKKFYNADQKPSIIIINGKIDKEELKRNNINAPFLLSQLRLKNYTRISDVEYALIEPNGQLSVIPKSQERSVKPKDLKVETQYEGLSIPLVIDGEIQYRNLDYTKLNQNWLNNELQKAGAINIEDVFFAELDTQGQLYVNLYKDANSNNEPLVF